MKIAVTGLSNSGKTTVFNALTGMSVSVTTFATTGGEPHIGVAKVPDERIDKLSEIYKPKKITYSTVEYIDYMGLTKGDQKQNRKVFEMIKDADALVHVVRAFEDDAVSHPLGGLDPVRDASTFETELIFGDLELVERRLEGMEQAAKKGRKPDEKEKRVLVRCKEALEEETALREIEFDADEMAAIRHLQFMSMKPEVVVINIGEQDLNKDKEKETLRMFEGIYGGKQSTAVITLCGKTEMEIAELPPEEQRVFLDDLGIEAPARDRLIRISYGLLGLISFLTAGAPEVRAWAIRKGSDALTAAGKIHTDIQRGFIRAEVVAYDDFIRLGGMAEAKDKGLFRLEGKTYEVKDGDIITFRFNV